MARERHEFEIKYYKPYVGLIKDAPKAKIYIWALDESDAERKFLNFTKQGSTSIISMKKTCHLSGKGHGKCMKCGKKT